MRSIFEKFAMKINRQLLFMQGGSGGGGEVGDRTGKNAFGLDALLFLYKYTQTNVQCEWECECEGGCE